jgi:hypothetical protein
MCDPLAGDLGIARPHDPLPWALDWFINRTNAGDIDSVLTTFAPNAPLHHAGVNIPPHVKYEFLASRWYIAGYINLRITKASETSGGWCVAVDVTGANQPLRDASGPYIFDFRLDEGKITELSIESAASDSAAHT